MPPPRSKPQPFRLKDCALIAIATGRQAKTLRELHEVVLRVHAGSIYYHFWGGLLRPKFDDPEYRNDFAIWARTSLRDPVLAERLAIVDPTDHEDLESLRAAVAAVLERHVQDTNGRPGSRAAAPFYFVRSQTVIFDCGRGFSSPEELAAAIPGLSLGSVFYHCVDARRRNPGRQDDFCRWIAEFGEDYHEVCRGLARVDYYFASLAELRMCIAERLAESLGSRSGGPAR